MALTTDPRERLVVAGNSILDCIFRLAETDEFNDRLQKIKDDKEALTNAMKDPSAIETLITRLKIAAELDKAKAEYVTLRATIEALMGGRD